MNYLLFEEGTGGDLERVMVCFLLQVSLATALAVERRASVTSQNSPTTST
jgi:hypothetical protein